MIAAFIVLLSFNCLASTKTESSCLPGWKLYASACYKVLSSTYTDYHWYKYPEAKQACHRELKTSHLPILKTQEDTQFHKQMSIPNCIGNLDYKRIWLAAKKVNNTWKWGEEGEDSKMGLGHHTNDVNGYAMWDDDQPEYEKEDRVQMYLHHKVWHNHVEHKRFVCGVICQYFLPQNGSWSEWVNDKCSVSCGTGIQYRRRTCTNPAPKNGGKECVGNKSETIVCNAVPCLSTISSTSSIDGVWSEWITDTCSVTCGIGSQYKRRTCTNPAPKNGGKICEGSKSEKQTCELTACKPVASPYYY